MCGHWIVSNVVRGRLKPVSVPNPHFRKPFLPKRSLRSKFFSRSKCEPTLDELDRPLNRYSGFERKQQVKMIGHDHKLVQTENPASTIFIDHFQE